MSKLGYCPVCEKEVNVEIKRIKKHFEEDGNEFDYYESVAICPNCGEEIYDDELARNNQIEFEKEYKKAFAIITNDEIKEILAKYRITKRNLPFVLGIGEQTITRYLDNGYIPSQKISNLLKKVLYNPDEYMILLEANKNKLKQNVYVKTKNQVNELLNIESNDQLIEDVAEYIITKNEETTNLVLQKLLYYVELVYMMFNKEKLYKSQCGAWDFGPVYGRIYYEYKSYKNNPIEKDYSGNKLSDDLKSIIDSVIKSFGCYSGKVLSNFTHSEFPWYNARENDETIIDKDNMIRFAKIIKERHKIETYSEISKYSSFMFSEYNKNF